MNGLQKVAVFVLGLAVVFVAAFAVGATLGPENPVPLEPPPSAPVGHGH